MTHLKQQKSLGFVYTPLGHGCNNDFYYYTAQWSTRRNQVIFAILDVSLNNGP